MLGPKRFSLGTGGKQRSALLLRPFPVEALPGGQKTGPEYLPVQTEALRFAQNLCMAGDEPREGSASRPVSSARNRRRGRFVLKGGEIRDHHRTERAKRGKRFPPAAGFNRCPSLNEALRLDSAVPTRWQSYSRVKRFGLEARIFPPAQRFALRSWARLGVSNKALRAGCSAEGGSASDFCRFPE